MHLGFVNPQGNFDARDRYWTEHADFGGQLVYVKNVALAMAELGHRVDILTRRVDDPEFPGLAAALDGYDGGDGVRIVRIDAGDDAGFVRKEELWPLIPSSWVPGIVEFYRGELPAAFTGHYGDGGIACVLLEVATGVPFTFTAHSLGAQKLDKLVADDDRPPLEALRALDAHFRFARRIVAERTAMSRSAINIVSTGQERREQYGHPAYAGAAVIDDDRRFAVVPPGVNLAVFDRDRKTPDTEVVAHLEAMLARDLDADRVAMPAIVASSRLEPKKNHLGLVEAFAGDAALQARANLVIITGNLDRPLVDDANAGPTEKRVLHGIRDVVADAGLVGSVAAFAVRGQRALADAYRHLVARRSVFTLPALYEPFGLAPLEASAAGLPVVVTQNGGPAESLRDDDSEYGVLVDPSDPGDIARGLRRVVDSPEVWEQFAAAGRRRVHERYTWHRTAEGYLAAITAATPPQQPLPIPPYFLEPGAETDIDVATLAQLMGPAGRP